MQLVRMVAENQGPVRQALRLAKWLVLVRLLNRGHEEILPSSLVFPTSLDYAMRRNNTRFHHLEEYFLG
jgi:hypothetical protein